MVSSGGPPFRLLMIAVFQLIVFLTSLLNILRLKRFYDKYAIPSKDSLLTVIPVSW